MPIPTSEQIAHIDAMLPRKPVGTGAPITDRQAWTQAASQAAFQKQLKLAERYAGEPVPELDTDALFAEYAKTGRRDIYEKPFRLRTSRLVAFAVAECVHNDGKFLPLIETEIQAILAQKTWGMVTQVNDHSPGAPGGVIDLAASCLASTLGTTDYWLGDRLQPETRRAIRDNVRSRIFRPYADAVRAGKPVWWWMVATTNWNPVCTLGVLDAALTLLDSPRDRAFYVQAALDSLSYFSGAFPDDGYCEEGTGYWSYGFGTYLCVAEELYQATHGQINLYAGANVRRMALFMRRFEIVPGVYPAFGDANPHTKGGPVSLMRLIDHRWGMGWPDPDPTRADMFYEHPLGDRLAAFGLFGFSWPDPAVAGTAVPSEEMASEDKRVFFQDNSVLVCRSIQPGRPPFGLAIKGGHNGSAHGHNDNGSYVVAYGDVPLIADPGTENYTAKTFSVHRFESMMMNSYGHSVPYVGQTLQKGGPESEGKILETHFTNEQDTLKMDLTSGYPVPGMVRLVRTYVFRRVQPSVEVIDEADFSEPTAYGSAVVTLSRWRENGPGAFVVDEKGFAATVTTTIERAEPADARIENKVEPITGFLQYPETKPVRLGMNLTLPVTHVTLRTRIVPTPVPPP